MPQWRLWFYPVLCHFLDLNIPFYVPSFFGQNPGDFRAGSFHEHLTKCDQFFDLQYFFKVPSDSWKLWSGYYTIWHQHLGCAKICSRIPQYCSADSLQFIVARGNVAHNLDSAISAPLSVQMLLDSGIPGDFSSAVAGDYVAPDLDSAISAPSFSPPSLFHCCCICFICFICAIDLFNPDIPHLASIADGAQSALMQ